ncbi:MAG: DUF2203 domain-containing protein [Planctomycetes bacterium]|nr:DUF2203 domain-containing protein [Planctomycetota bacterium]
MSEQPSDRPEKIFTAEEANALLPQVISLVKQLQGIQRSITKTNQQLTEGTGKLSQGNGNPIQSVSAQIEDLAKHQLQLIDAFKSALDQLEDLGAMLKDAETGLVDFYAIRDGEIVFLCWKLGEDRVRFWHTLEAGVAGRQPL